jgi:protease IV
MSDVAASGGYFIAMGCRKIVAEPGTVTGSIGVVSAKFNLKGMYDWLGLRFETVKRGKWADEMSDTRAMTPEERERFRARTYRFYETFVTKAAQSRHKKYEELDAVAQGRVWMGSQAIGIGLVDALGGMDRAVELARESAGIPKTRKVRLVEYPEPRKLMDQILESIAETRLETLDPTLRKTLRYLGGFAMPGPGAPLAMMPYLIEIH